MHDINEMLRQLTMQFERPFMPPLSVKAKSIDPKQLHDRIRRSLRSNEPKLMRLLYGAWSGQANVLTTTDLARAARTGKLTPATLDRWQQQYNTFVTGKLTAFWRTSAINGFNLSNFQLSLINKPPVAWDDFRVKLDKWTRERGGELIVSLTDLQSTAVNNLLQWHISHDPLTPTELGIRLRASIPLTPREERAVRRRFAELLSTPGVSRAAAIQRASQYAGYLHRVRATRIARTELAFAYNRAQFDTMQEAIDQGLIDGSEKIWLTAEDERVCVICGALDNVTIGIDESFTSGGLSVQTPPIHPSCRCVLLYEPTD